MSKMGISTMQSYRGAQIFEAIGLNSGFVAKYFDKTASRIEGIGLPEIAEEALVPPPPGLRRSRGRPRPARGGRPVPVAPRRRVPPVQPRDGLPPPARHPDGRADIFKSYTTRVDEQNARLCTLRGLFEFKLGGPDAGADRGGRAGRGDRPPLRHRGDELRLDLGRGARDARHRHEPPRRQVEHRRRGRGPRPGSSRCRTATAGGRRSSRSPPAASA